MGDTKIWLRDPEAAVAEDFGDEVIVMNPVSGAFYSLRGRAADVWRGCAAGVAVSDVTDIVAAQDADEASVLAGMLQEFQATGVLSQGPGPGPAERVIVLGDTPASFTKNDDFNDLIRLDPIHDVDDAGWPFTK